MNLSRIILTAFLIFLVSAGYTAAQNDSKKSKPSSDRPLVVKGNVQVLDAQGNHVSDLKPEQMKVFEDGVEQKITYFTRKGPALDLGLVMDNTGSMRTQLEQLVFAGGSFVDSLTANDEAFVVRFVSSEKIEVIQEWTADKFKLNEALANMYTEGGQSAVLDALYLSAEKLLEREQKDNSRRYAIVLISDGEDRDSFYELKELLSLFKDSDLQIFVIGITAELPKNRVSKSSPKHPKDFSEDLSQLLALETGGTAFVLSTKYTGDDLRNITKSIAAELRYQYVIGYTSTNKKRDGLARKLRVEIADGEKGEKRQGFIRESFVVPKEKQK